MSSTERDSSADQDSPPETERERHQRYWRANLTIVAVLLVIWFVVSYGFGILLVEPLNEFRLPGTGYPLGFWFAQQGSIFTFVVLVFAYVGLMGWLDRRFDVDEGDDPEVAR